MYRLRGRNRKQIHNTKEWRYYGQSDTRHSSDPNRVYIRKSEERNIYKDVENMSFSEKIVNEANILSSDTWTNI